MNRTIRQDRILKVAIGAEYKGPRFDRPALRQMPRHWTLEEARKPQRGLWRHLQVLILLAFAGSVLFGCAQAFMGIVR